MAGGALYRGDVVHKRVTPVEHKLRYRVFSMLLDVDTIDETAAKLNLFSVNRFNLFSLRQSDHGFRDHRTLSEFARTVARDCGAADQIVGTKVLFYPRILGFAFNPLTVYYGLNDAGGVVLAIYEVRNTFGEDLTYVLQAGAERAGTYTHRIEKSFYVSPFNTVDGDYTFHITRPGEELTVGVALKDENGPVLRTHFKGSKHALTDKGLLKVFVAYPLMTLKIVAGIHWEALKLWKKGLRMKAKPKAPDVRLVFGDKRA
ncbi:MAG: DUF1365 domain-containing protein [Pseudomonadota bacterium]